MKHAALRVAALACATALAPPASAQTVNDDTPATANFRDRVGAGFFSEATLLTPRSESEIRAHWTGLSEDDRAAVRARCAARQGQPATPAALLQESDNATDQNATDTDGRADENAGNTASNTGETNPAATATGSVNGQEMHGQAMQSSNQSDPPAPTTGLAGGVENQGKRMLPVCDLIRQL